VDINSLGAAYIDEYRLGSGGLSGAVGGAVNRGNVGAGNTPDFEALLKRAADNATPAEDAVHSSRTVTIDKTDKLYEQCLELEIFLVKTLISSMRSTVQKSGLIEEGFAGKMYEDMLYDEYARDFTKNANFGLAETAYLELTGQRGKVIIRN